MPHADKTQTSRCKKLGVTMVYTAIPYINALAYLLINLPRPILSKPGTSRRIFLWYEII